LQYLGRAIIPVAIVIALVSPVGVFLLPRDAIPIRATVLDGQALGGDPWIVSTYPPETAYVGVMYAFNATCTSPDNGTTTWALETNASWLSVESGGTGVNTCNLSGTAILAGLFYVNITVFDDDSYDFLNWTIRVWEQGYWGVVDTLSGLPTGTHDPFNGTLAGGNLSLRDADVNEESVVLDGTLATFSRADEINKTIAVYTPDHADDGVGWNMSVELYPTREATSYTAVLKPVPELGMIVYLGNDSVNMTAVALYVGDRSLGLERVSVLNATSSLWTNLSSDIIPSYPNRHDNNPGEPQFSESIYGERPDHYIVSFRYAEGSSVVNVTVLHSSGVLVGSMNVSLPAEMPSDIQLTFVTDSDLPAVPQRGYWMIDNICMRGLGSRYPVAGPTYEYVLKGSPLWISVKDVDRKQIQDAEVVIAGHHASYNASTMRYEALLSLSVGWSQRVQYSVTVDGVTLTDAVLVTVMPDLQGEKVSIPLWWNGWAWVSVFGRDDSPYATAAYDTYAAYGLNHPTTSYIMSAAPGGASSNILPSQSEIALHWPHDYTSWPERFWDDAVVTSDVGHLALEDAYTFASRWDNPDYVGAGDMYITIASPGNSASWEQMYAEFARGTRIMGFTSNYYNGAPGNYSLIGSWYSQTIPPVMTRWNAPSTEWYPYTPYDMMDTARGPNTDVTLPSVEWQMTFWIAQNGGVRRIYNHGIISPSAAVFLHWIDDPKTNFSYENWKATDGEVASYVYGRWSTDITFDEANSNTTVSSYHVTRADPISAGYWRVPVTIAFNATGHQLSDIIIKEGSVSLSMSDGSLRNITGKRIMDVGYDIRGGTVYVSYFWNASAELSFVFADIGPEPNTPPTASFVADSYHDNMTKTFVFDASSSYDAEDPLSALQFRWDWEGDGIWDTAWSSDPIAHHQFMVPGNYTVKLQVMDTGGLTSEAQASIEVTDIEIPEMQSIFFVSVSMLMVFAAVAHLSRRKGRS
jgi:hypothetical protein